jgi:hypothetical protein
MMTIEIHWADGSIVVNSQRSLAVIHFTNEEYEEALTMQKGIKQALARGRNVVLVYEAPVLRRMERLAFACLGVHKAPGRFAIVTEDVDQFSEAIPSVIAAHLQVFSSQREAFDWLNPAPVNVEATRHLMGS